MADLIHQSGCFSVWSLPANMQKTGCNRMTAYVCLIQSYRYKDCCKTQSVWTMIYEIWYLSSEMLHYVLSNSCHTTELNMAEFKETNFTKIKFFSHFHTSFRILSKISFIIFTVKPRSWPHLNYYLIYFISVYFINH